MNEALLDRKVEEWEGKLLDLGKRNKMVSYRETSRATLKIVEPVFQDLFDAIVQDEKQLTFQRIVDRDTDARVYSLSNLMEILDSPVEISLGDIKVRGSLAEAKKTLKNLRDKARLAMDEQGINILYLVFGFIEWREPGKTDYIKSPLILVPVSLTLDSVNAPYTLKKYDDDIVVNPTLAHIFKENFNLELPSFDPDKDTLAGFMKEMENLIALRGWQLIENVSLGLVSFLKINMYKDMIEHEDSVKNNPIIRALVGESNEISVNNYADEVFNHDDESSTDVYQVVDADSSQKDAIELSKRGVSFVMQGPPGTGKSQTITNIIAEGLAAGKKILFVSEKMAALDVVYRRLDEVGLSDFCLSLHSHKANKKDILAQIGNNLDLKSFKINNEEYEKLAELDSIRTELAAYVNDVHEIIQPLEMTLYEVYGELSAYRDYPDVNLCLNGAENLTKMQVNKLALKLGELQAAKETLGEDWKNNPWNGIENGYLSSVVKAKLKNAIQESIALLDNLGTYKLNNKSFLDWFSLGRTEQNTKAFKTFENGIYYAPCWNDKGARVEAKALLREVISKSSSLEILKTNINSSFKELGILLSDTDANMETVEALEVLAQPIEDGKVLLENANNGKVSAFITDFESHFQEYYASRQNFVQFLQNIGMGIDDSPENIKLFVSNNEKAILECKPLPSWIDDIVTVNTNIADVESKANALRNRYNAFMQTYEKSLFDLDFQNMLNRFKTDYTGLFSFMNSWFNSAYKADVKAVKLVYKQVKNNISNEEIVNLLQDLKSYNEELDEFNNKARILQNYVGLSAIDMWTDLTQIKARIALFESLAPYFASRKHLYDFLNESKVNGLNKSLLELETISSWFKHNEGRTILGNRYQNENTDIQKLKEDMSRIQENVKKFNNFQDYLSYLSTYDGNRKIEKCISDIIKIIDIRKWFANKTSAIKVLLDQDYDEEYKGWEKIDLELDETEIIFDTFDSETCVKLLTEEAGSLKELKVFVKVLEKLEENSALLMCFVELFGSNKQSLLDLKLSALRQRLVDCGNAFYTMEQWIDYRDIFSECKEAGLESFIEELEKVEYDKESLPKIFMKSFYNTWLGFVIDNHQTVARFKTAIHNIKINMFKELDKHQLLLARKRIRAKLISEMPKRTTASRAADEMSILMHELMKKSRIMPIRKLFKSIPYLLMKLKPCLMMSPLSVAYFLDANTYKFDMVIFDEASQVFPQDAIGAIARGSQVIIAGDSKQMPPTNFFNVNTGNADEYDTADDEYVDVTFDSILEGATSALPSRSLLWHYRSRNEDLIAFSNRTIYNNSLITFPTQTKHQDGSGVEYIYVEDGIYENGCNIKEAKKIVSLVIEHFKKYPERSLGVIAFSEKQQGTIEDVLQEYRVNHPEYEKFFSDDLEDPFFIKNLENVQGDERDTIIFSIGYGKNPQGRMYMRFGPLGMSGGERRLNVAATRAKRNVKLVGSVMPSDFDLSKTKAEGVRMLKDYVLFAIKGSETLPQIENNNRMYENDMFITSVTNFLEEKGFTVDTNVGNSDYTIDIAVKHPKYPDSYLAGIECDGDSYHMAQTVRDRDALRPSVLKSMGWNMYRVWSTAWVRNPVAEQEGLMTFLQLALDEYDKKINDQNASSNGEFDDDIEVEFIDESETKNRDDLNIKELYGLSEYEEAPYPGYVNEGNNKAIADKVKNIVSFEEPIHLQLLYRRMAGPLGYSKATVAVREKVDFAVYYSLQSELQISDGFVRFREHSNILPRCSRLGMPDRNIEHISSEEIIAAMKLVLKNAYGMEQNVLVLETAKIFGFERTGMKIKKIMNAAIERMRLEGTISMHDAKIQLLED